MIKVDCISDLHGYYPKLEGGDLLIVAGDLTASDKQFQYLEFREWLLKQNYKKKVFIAGNHDRAIQDGRFYFNDEWFGADYLYDSGIEFSYFIDGFPEEDTGFLPSGKRTLKIWGSPWTLAFEGMNPHCKAFTVDTEAELAEKWALIPDDIDILVTHSPPLGCRDLVNINPVTKWGKSPIKSRVGSKSLLMKVKDLQPKLVVFGHIHEAYGLEEQEWNFGNKTILVNASHVDENYRPVNKPIRVEL